MNIYTILAFCKHKMCIKPKCMGIKTKLARGTDVLLWKYNKEKEKQNGIFPTEKGEELYTNEEYTAYFSWYAKKNGLCQISPRFFWKKDI